VTVKTNSKAILFEPWRLRKVRPCSFCKAPAHNAAWTIKPAVYLFLCDDCHARLRDGDELELRGTAYLGDWSGKLITLTPTRYHVDWAAFGVKAEGWD